MDVKKVGEYSIVAIGQDHAKNPIRSLVTAKLLLEPGAVDPKKITCKWIDDSPPSKIAELGESLSTIVVVLKDSTGSVVKPVDVKPHVTCQLSGSSIPVTVNLVNSELQNSELHVSIKLTAADKQLPCVIKAVLTVQVKLADGSCLPAGVLECHLGTGAPASLCIQDSEALQHTLSTPIERSLGLPAFTIALKDCHDRNCVFEIGQTPQITVCKDDGTALIGPLDLGADGSLKFRDQQVKISGLLCGQTDVKLQIKILDVAGEQIQYNGRPVVADLPTFRVSPRHLVLNTAAMSVQPQGSTVSVEVEKTVDIQLAVFGEGGVVSKDITGILTVTYEPTHLSCGSSEVAVSNGRATLSLTPKVHGVAAYDLAVSIECNQISGPAAKLALTLKCEPPATAPSSLVVPEQLAAKDSSPVDPFSVEVLDGHGNSVDFNASGNVFYIKAKGLGCNLTQKGVGHGDVFARVALASGKAVFDDVSVSLTQPSQETVEASVEFTLCVGDDHTPVDSVSTCCMFACIPVHAIAGPSPAPPAGR